MKIAESALELVGHTPLVRLHKIAVLHGSENPVVAKLERFNPAGSAKDRVALRMIEDAERCGAPAATPAWGWPWRLPARAIRWC